MAPRLFISYRTEDSVFAGRIYDSLKRTFGGGQIFFDQRSIPAGSKWDVEIDRSLAECRAFILVITPRWLASFAEHDPQSGPDYHLREIEMALDRSIPVFPLVIDEAEPPHDHALPPQLRGRLPMIQWERVRNDRTFDDSMVRLIDQIQWVLGERSGSSLPPPPERPAPSAPPSAPTYRPSPASWNASGPAPAVDPMSSSQWRWRHALWPWSVLCCGFATWAVFLYIGAQAKRRDWLIAGAAYLVGLIVAAGAVSIANDDRPNDSTPAEMAATVVFLVYWVIGTVHLVAVTPTWLRWRAGFEAAAPAPAPAPAPGGIERPGSGSAPRSPF